MMVIVPMFGQLEVAKEEAPVDDLEVVEDSQPVATMASLVFT